MGIWNLISTIKPGVLHIVDVYRTESILRTKRTKMVTIRVYILEGFSAQNKAESWFAVLGLAGRVRCRNRLDKLPTFFFYPAGTGHVLGLCRT